MVLPRRIIIPAFGLLLALSVPLVVHGKHIGQPQKPESIGKQEQNEIGRHRRKGKRLGFGFAQLDLTTEQRQQTQAILRRHLDSIRSQREELLQLRDKRITASLTADDQARAKLLHQQLAEARQGVLSELLNVLTPEQRIQLEQIESRQKEKREERSRRRLPQ